MKVIKGRSGKFKAVDEYIKLNLSQGKKVVIFDTVGAKAAVYEGSVEHFLVQHPFRALALNFVCPQFNSLIQDADLIVFYANTEESNLEMVKKHPFESRSLITVQSDSEIEIIEV